jgi:hypothetical protein
MFSDAEEDLTDNDSVISSVAADYSKEICLFCCQTFVDFETNLKHMTQVHGFFLPDVEYLEDPEGLVSYLAEKISDCICLYCNGRGKEWKSQPAVRKHMVRKRIYIFIAKYFFFLIKKIQSSWTKDIAKWHMMKQRTLKPYYDFIILDLCLNKTLKLPQPIPH